METSLTYAFERFEEETGEKIEEALEVDLSASKPFIEKMEEEELERLEKCEKLNLVLNCIEELHFPPLANLKILSLGRNLIKSFEGLEALGDTLEELWVSYNEIEKVRGIEEMKNLKVLYMAFNEITEWSEVKKLDVLSENLENLKFHGNPLVEDQEFEEYYPEILIRLPFLKIIDGELVDIDDIIEPEY